MKTPKRYPKTLKIRNTEYKLKFVKDISQASGLCDGADGLIIISKRQSPDNIFRTLIHEVIHAIEGEYEIKMSHENVYKFERAIFRFMKDNL